MDDSKWIFDPSKMRKAVWSNKKRKGKKCWEESRSITLQSREMLLPGGEYISSPSLCLLPFDELFSCKEKPIGLTSSPHCLWPFADCMFSVPHPWGGIQIKPP